MTPTARCAALLGAVALLALVVPVAGAVALALAALAVSAADGWSVRRAPALRRSVAGVLSRGVATPLRVSALAPDGRRVLLRQPALPGALGVRATAAAPRELGGEIVPLRRGRHRLPGVASASLGPLGLARWHHPAGEASEVLVYPDLLTARRMVLRLRHGRSAAGELRRGPLGLGTDFESVRDYSPDDDIRQVNWPATARTGRPMSNQYRIEQDREVMCLLDVGRLTLAPTADGTLLDVTVDAVTAIALVADELGDRCGAIAFDGSIRRVLAPRRGGGRRVIEALVDLQPSAEDSDFERAFLRVGGARRALVFVLSDLIDAAAARSLVDAAPMLARRHALTVVSVSDPQLDAAVARAPSEDADVREMVAALSVLEAREETVGRLRATGAEIVQAPPSQLSERCVQSYLRAKARARL